MTGRSDSAMAPSVAGHPASLASPEMTADPTLGKIVRLLVAKLHPQRVYLFGSRARGDAQNDSDYDVLLLVHDKDDRPFGSEQEAYGALFGVGVGVDVIVMTLDYFERRQIVKASLPATVGREGRLLYVA